MFSQESLSSRLAKPEKCEFIFVNDHFEGKYNEEIGLNGQTINRLNRMKLFVKLEIHAEFLL